LSRERIPCGAWLAWARIAVPACWRIWVLVKVTISAATSRSRIRESEAARFSDETPRLYVGPEGSGFGD